MAQVDFSNLPGNSNAEKQKKQQEKDIKPVYTGNVIRKERSIGRKLMDTFLADSIEDVKTYVIFDVLVPHITDTILEMVNQGLGMLFKGDPRGSRGSRSSNSGSGAKPTVAYHSFYDSPKKSSRRSSRDNYEMEELIVPTRGEAEMILDNMIDILENYPVVTVGDLMELVGLSTSPADFNYGWTDLSVAGTKRVHDGYLIDLPRAKRIKE